MKVIELSKEGQGLEWREHALSSLMRLFREDGLAFEPATHPAGSLDGRQLTGIKLDGDGVSWDWGPWEKVDAAPVSRGQRYAPIKKAAGEENFVPWKTALSSNDKSQGPYCDWLELTPWDKKGEPGVTIRIERPVLIDTGMFSFQLVYGEFGKQVRISLSSEDLDPQRIKVQRFQFGGDGYVPVGSEKKFGQQRQVDVSVRNFRGAIAVIEVTERKEQRLLTCRWFSTSGGGLRSVNDEEDIAEIRTSINSSPAAANDDDPSKLREWLDQWPHRSGERLRLLYQITVNLVSPRAALQLNRHNPTGLLRAIVLTYCGFPRNIPFDQLADQLKAGDFSQALRLLLPALPVDFSRFPPLAQQWMIRHAGDEDFEKALDWVGGNDERKLELALKLAGLREEVRKLLDTLTHGVKVHNQVGALLREIEQAPHIGVNPEMLQELSSKAREMKDRVEYESRRPVDIEQGPPIKRELNTEYEQKIEGMNLWRRKLAQVLTYCEIGTWELPDQTPAPIDLRKRLGKISVPSWAPSYEPDMESGGLARAQIRELLDKRHDEPQQELRELACERLENVINPYALHWGSLHAQLRRAIIMIDAEPELYAWLAPTFIINADFEDLQSRVVAAQHFLAVTGEAEKHLRSWKTTRLTAAPNDREELRRIMFNPDHPRIAVSFERCLGLYEFLDSPRYRTGISRPTAPEAPSAVAPVESFSAWWKSLREMDTLLEELEQCKVEFDGQVRNLLDSVIPDVQRLLNFNAERPHDERPGFYDQLAELHRQIFAEGDGMGPRTLFALTGFLSDHDDWRKYVPPKTEEPDGVLTEVGGERV